jgi:hypothetical protein
MISSLRGAAPLEKRRRKLRSYSLTMGSRTRRIRIGFHCERGQHDYFGVEEDGEVEGVD